MRIRDEAQKTEARREALSILARARHTCQYVEHQNAETSALARVFKPQ
jgi:hypothetical protein